MEDLFAAIANEKVFLVLGTANFTQGVVNVYSVAIGRDAILTILGHGCILSLLVTCGINTATELPRRL